VVEEERTFRVVVAEMKASNTLTQHPKTPTLGGARAHVRRNKIFYYLFYLFFYFLFSIIKSRISKIWNWISLKKKIPKFSLEFFFFQKTFAIYAHRLEE
jgi:hypothetical protein